MRTILKQIAWLLLAVSPSLAVTVTAKVSGTSSPISVAATASSSHPITGWTIYVDSGLVYKADTSSTTLSRWVSISTGTHKLTIKAWDSSGANGAAYFTVNVSSSTTSTGMIPKPPSSAKVFSNIDQMTGWTACSACANGTVATYWYKQNVSSPSLDGRAMQTYIKGSYGLWADNLFVKKFGDQTWAKHILWTISFRWNAPKIRQPNGNYVVQGIEFDARMLQGDFKYLFGTQCSYGSGWWDIWNNTKRYWQHTSVPCQKWGPNTWHTVTWYLERDTNTKYLHYAVLEVDGKQYKIDKWLPAGSVPYNKEFLIQFEQNTDLYGDPWYLYVDKLKATIW